MIKLINLEILKLPITFEIVLLAIRRRYSQSNRLKITAINTIRCVLGINKVSLAPNLKIYPTSGTWFKCAEAIVGKKSYKAER